MSQPVEIGQSISTCGYQTNYHDMGNGKPLVLLHGSGPGVSGWANWRGVAPRLAEEFRVLIPDQVGFGYTAEPADFEYKPLQSWVEQITAFIEALELGPVTLVGNSFGGAVALALTIARPDLVERLICMGAVGTPGIMTPELDEIWGYTPSIDSMKRMLDIMAFDRKLVTDELAELRYQASIRSGVQERYSRLFPAPRQRWLDAVAQPLHKLAAIQQETLILHGRDDRVIPLDHSLLLHQMVPNSQLHVFGNCGHWTQIEQADRFVRLVADFTAGRL